MRNLTNKQKRFCEEYLIDLNGTQSYIRAGYSANVVTASRECHKLLKNPEVQAYINELQEMRSRRTEITQDRVLLEIASIGFSRITDVMEFSESNIKIKDSSQLTYEVIAAIAEVSSIDSGKVKRTSVKLYDKMQALKMLADHLGMFNDFENSIRTLANKYGLLLRQNDEGNWVVENRRVSTDSTNIITENPTTNQPYLDGKDKVPSAITRAANPVL